MTLVTNVASPNTSTSLTKVQGHRGAYSTLAAFTRPIDTNAYATGDVVSDSTGTAAALEFPNAAKQAGGGGRVMGVLITMDSVKVTDWELHLFSAEPTNHADNAPLSLVAADMTKYVGIIPVNELGSTLPAPAGFKVWTENRGFGTATADPFRPRYYVLDAASSSLYGLLRTRTAWTPKSGARINIHLDLELD